MGSTAAERLWAIAQGGDREQVNGEAPQHLVRIAYPLAVGRYPVTFEEYDAFCGETGHGAPDDEGWGRGRRPAVNVSWDDAEIYIAWLATQTRQPYRLLSEAEWEYACRAGTRTRYWWGDEITHANANWRNGDKTSEVGAYDPNPFELCDTHGNVWEWCEDRWHESDAGAPADGSAWLEGDRFRRLVRGGSWLTDPVGLRSAIRVAVDSVAGARNLGFRVARTLTP